MTEGNSPLLYIDFSTFSPRDQVEGADFLLAGRSALIQVNSIALKALIDTNSR